ncbi:MAG: hypothetical protein ACLQOO_28875 [Terriglobia bacterium]
MTAVLVLVTGGLRPPSWFLGRAVYDRRTALAERRYKEDPTNHGVQTGRKPVYTFSDRPDPLLDAGARLVTADFFSP